MTFDRSALLGFLSFGFISQLVSCIPWTFVFIFIRYLGINLYILKNKESCNLIQKKLNNHFSHITDEGKGYGYSIGYFYIVNLSAADNNGEYAMSVWIISTKNSFNKLIEEPHKFIESCKSDYLKLNDQFHVSGNNDADIAYRKGSLNHIYYIKRTAQIEISPMPQQYSIINTLADHYRKYSHAVALIHGPPGTGKSMIGLLLAKELNGIHCDSARFWEPGDTLDTIYNDLSISNKFPLILTFDEIDKTILDLNNGILPHKNIPIYMRGKTHWNQFFDKIGIGFHRNIIVILTTNKTPADINKIDTSYIRKGRVDYIYELKDVILDL